MAGPSDTDFLDLAFVIDRSLEMAFLAIGPNKDLIQVQSPLDLLARRAPLLPPELGGKERPEPVPPEPYAFMAGVDAAFVQQVLDLAYRKWEPDVEQNCGPDHRRGAVEKAEGIAHPISLSKPNQTHHRLCPTLPRRQLRQCASGKHNRALHYESHPP